MHVSLTVHDETTSGSRVAGPTLEFPTERITVRELIRERVYQEVQDHNRRSAKVPGGGLGYRGEVHEVDWGPRFRKACRAFEEGKLLIIVGDRQVEGLDAVVGLERMTSVTFLRLIPLVGG